MVKRFQRCVGLSFPAIGRWKLEIWFVPARFAVEAHTHVKQDIELVLLFAHGVRLYRQRNRLVDMFSASLRHFGRHFTIRAGDLHWFAASRWPFVFLNIEHWHCKPTSACEDIQFVKEN